MSNLKREKAIFTIDVEKIIESSNFPAFILSKDLVILKVNQAFLDFFKVKREEVEGRRCHEFVHGLQEVPEFCPLHGETYLCPFTGCGGLAQEVAPPPCCPKKGYTFSNATTFKTFYQKFFYEPKLKKYLSVTLIPFFDEKENLKGYLHFIEDKTKETELKELLFATFDTFLGLFFVNDEKFQIIYANRQMKALMQDDEECFKVLYGRNEHCPGCPLFSEVKEAEDLVYSPKLNRYFLRYYRKLEKNSRILKLTFYHDITEEVRLFEENPIAIAISTIDGELVRANKRAYELFKVPERFRERISTQNFWENLQDRERFIAELITKGEVRAFETKLKDWEGNSFYALLSSKIHFTKDRSLIYTCIEDISKYLEIKEEWQRFFETMVELLPVGLALLDFEGKTLYVNGTLANLTGYTKDELLGKSLHELLAIDEGMKERARKRFQELARTGQSHLAGKRVQVKARRKDGTFIPLEVYFVDVNFLGQRAFLGIVLDITERLILEEKSLRETRAQTVMQIASGLAHELNNLLMVLKGHLELLEMKLKDFMEILGKERTLNFFKHLEKVFASTDKISQKVAELYLLSGKDLPRVAEVDLKSFLERWLPFYLQGKEIKLEMDVKEGLRLMMEERHLVSVIENLVINAIEAMEGQGRLRVSANEEGDAYVIMVEDTGPGIPPEILPHIFEPGFSTKSTGTGLGLTVVKKIVDLYEGTISINSEPGRGTRFILRLPKRLPFVKFLKTAPQEIKKRRKILILEDDPEVRELLEEVLREEDFEVMGFAEGDSAYEAYLSALALGEPFDFLLLDLIVPEGKGGVYLLERLIKEGKLPVSVKVVLMTGYTSQEVSERAKFVRYDAVLYKPFSLDKLLTLLRMEGG